FLPALFAVQRLAVALLLLLSFALPASALEHVVCQQEGKTVHLDGKVLSDLQGGGLVLQTRDGRLWNITGKELQQRDHDDAPFNPCTAAELRKQTLAELPTGFDTISTAHYMIFFNTSRGFAQWSGALFERLYSAFNNFWTHRGFKMHDASLPLVVIIYADRQTYAKQAADEIGAGSKNVIGYYHLFTNRVKTFDLTGVESLRQSGEKRVDAAQQVNQLLSQPQAEIMVATIIHEATHQIAFNCGLQQRLADVPLWVSEGLATYFETPDLNYGKGWRTIGEVNPPRLDLFHQYMNRRPADSLTTLLIDDKRFRNPEGALDAYAEAWSLNYFLLRQHAKEYQAYLEVIAAKEPLETDSPEERVKEFKSAFGNDLAALDAEFLRYMARVK
ncbi:MAG TPA: DUF1570 domain-containing protein, partial [Pirellulales bacterium]